MSTLIILWICGAFLLLLLIRVIVKAKLKSKKLESDKSFSDLLKSIEQQSQNLRPLVIPNLSQSNYAKTVFDFSVTLAIRKAAAEYLTNPDYCAGVVLASNETDVVNIVVSKAFESVCYGDVVRKYLEYRNKQITPDAGLKSAVRSAIKEIFFNIPKIHLTLGYYRKAESDYKTKIKNPPKGANEQNVYNQILEDSYNLAIFYWSFIGNGDKAMQGFENVWTLYEKEIWTDKNNLNIVAYACENAMLLCVSADEFIEWRERLRKIAPNTRIISEIGTTYINRYESGTPWWELMTEIGLNTFYNRMDSSLDSGRYGNGASLWQRMISHRKKLRLPKEAWENAVTEYGILALRLSAQEESKQQGKMAMDLYEIGYPVYKAYPFVEEYVKFNPGGIIENDILGDIKKNIELYEKYCL